MAHFEIFLKRPNGPNGFEQNFPFRWKAVKKPHNILAHKWSRSYSLRGGKTRFTMKASKVWFWLARVGVRLFIWDTGIFIQNSLLGSCRVGNFFYPTTVWYAWSFCVQKIKFILSLVKSFSSYFTRSRMWYVSILLETISSEFLIFGNDYNVFIDCHSYFNLFCFTCLYHFWWKIPCSLFYFLSFSCI